MLTLAKLFKPEGPLANLLTGYNPRPQQLEMAQAIATAIAEESVLIAEAGTGTGKTLAYLLPALLSGGKIIISTGTKTLQDQLFSRDLPLAGEVLDLPVNAALLKGRANYLCRYRLQRAVDEGRLRSREQAGQVMLIAEWAGRTTTGDISEVTGVPEESQVWQLVTSSADNCVGQECPDFDECLVLRARRRAQEADVVVINHHLLFADMVLKRDGFGELLPSADAFILDEAHQLPEIAANFFGSAFTARQVLELARDSEVERVREALDAKDIAEGAAALETEIKRVRLAFGEGAQRSAWHLLDNRAAVEEALEELLARIVELERALDAAATRGKGLASCWSRATTLRSQLELSLAGVRPGHVRWVETFTHTFVIHETPLDISEPFREQLDALPHTWILTSATLTVAGKFDHFQLAMGLEGATTQRWDSPFDYAKQALLYTPEGLPEPNSPSYTGAVVAAALPVIEFSNGRTFLLFTSHRALQEAAEQLREQLEFPILVQGEAPRGELLRRFRELGNAILLGTSSFWEGVDVRGDALICVVIDRLPFASPGDPVVQARIDALREQGIAPFPNYQLPQAVISLKQGVGRLIRDRDDYGILMLCDPRLIEKSYGGVFLRSLPPMSKTRKSEVVERFLKLHQDGESLALSEEYESACN